jgi:hypothetical protein
MIAYNRIEAHSNFSKSSQPLSSSDIFKFFLIVIFYFCVFFTPKIYYGSIHFRYEDLLTFFLFITVLFTLKKDYFYVSFTFFIYMAYISFFTLLNVIVSNANPYSIIILGKELQYFLVFLLILFSVDKPRLDTMIKFFLTPAIIFVVIFAIFSLYTDNRGAYGLRYVNDIAPSTSAIAYFNFLFLAIILMFYYFRKNSLFFTYIFLLSAIVLFISFIATASRTAFLVSLLMVVLFPFHVMKFRYAVSILILLLLSLLLVYFNRFDIHTYVSLNKPDSSIFYIVNGRLNSLLLLFDNYEVLQGARVNSWKDALSHVNSWNIFFGNGRGFFSATDGMKGLGTDSQVTRNIVEIGVIGTSLFFLTLMTPLKYLKDIWKSLYILYLFLYLFWSLAAEIFLISKGGQMFWLVCGVLLILSSNEKKIKIIEEK